MPKKKSILIVDDEKDITKMLEAFLSNYDFDVCSADNAENALTLLKIKCFDILITDHAMPGMNGAEFAKIVKSLYPQTFIIGTSGNPNHDNFINAGAEAPASRIA